MIRAAMDASVLAEDQTFSLHDLKHAGRTLTQGTHADNRDAGGRQSEGGQYSTPIHIQPLEIPLFEHLKESIRIQVQRRIGCRGGPAPTENHDGPEKRRTMEEFHSGRHDRSFVCLPYSG